MSKTDELNELFARWRQRRIGRFNADGILDDARWATAPRRVLFLMKETNDFDGDLRALDFPSAGWLPLGFWAYVIHTTTTTSIQSFSVPQSDDSLWKLARHSSAFMNFKKETGCSSSDLSTIKMAAGEDKSLLQEELKIIDPEIVVTCGPGMLEIAREVFDLGRPNQSGYRWQRHGMTTWIDFFHPSGRYPHFMYYYSLAVVFQDSLWVPS